MNSKKIEFSPVIPDYHDWELYKMGLNRAEIVDTLTRRTIEKFNGKDIVSFLEKAVYLERERIRTSKWPIDPPDEDVYWNQIRKELYKLNTDEFTDKHGNGMLLLERIVRNYAEEIIGRFNPNTHKFARVALPFFFSQILNAASAYNIRDFLGRKHQLHERIKVGGHIEQARTLANKGTLLLLPTHFSNLDSILIGWAMDMIGLPPFVYGAGLNLFNNRLVGYFMSRLGAYRVDRRKKNEIYLETLKTFSSISFEQGAHTLFFPGGTRSRFGAIENKLKLGLLGTAFEAQKKHCEFNYSDPKKIFVFPLVISYNNVLEAGSLIDDYLKQTGKEKYYIWNDESENFIASLKFVWKFFRTSSEIHLTLGEPFDLFGNKLDLEGQSFDPSGNKVNVSDYFFKEGKIHNDNQRDAQYNIALGEIVCDKLLSENLVLPSHLIAFVAFRLILKMNSKLNLYDVLRLDHEKLVIPKELFENTIQEILELLKEKASKNELKLEKRFENNVQEIIFEGIKNLSVFHMQRAIKKDKNGDYVSENLNLLYYYHNRLIGYELENYIR